MPEGGAVPPEAIAAPPPGWGAPGTSAPVPPAGPPGFGFGFCTRCGAALTGVAFCTACGAPAGAPPRKGLGLGWIVGGLVVGFLLVASCLSAIAIPNFVRYRLRARQAVVQAELGALVNAQVAHAQAGKGVVPFDAVPADPPGTEQRPLRAEDLAVARELGWKVGPDTHGQYRVAVRKDAAGNVALAFCAETDLDGDGRTAAIVAFLPTIDAQGAVLQDPPEPPCSARAEIGPDGNLYRPAWRGKLVIVSPGGVY